MTTPFSWHQSLSNLGKALRIYFALWAFCLVASILYPFLPNYCGYSHKIGDMLLLTGSVFFQYLLLYQCWKQIPSDIARTTPGKAIGYLFIPLFNLYWMFVAYDGLIKDMSKALQRRGIQFPINKKLGSLYCELWLFVLPVCACQWVGDAPTSVVLLSITSAIFIVGGLALLINLFVLIGFLRTIKNGAIALLECSEEFSDIPASEYQRASASPSVKESIFVTVSIIGTLCLVFFLFQFSNDRTTSILLMHFAAERGDAEAQAIIGDIFYNSESILDKATSVEWYRKAAEQGHARAQFMLGLCYHNGEGVLENKEEALNWFRKGAEQENKDAQGMVGWCYVFGEGVPEDKAEGIKWLRKAAEQGHEGATELLRKLEKE